MTIQISFDNTKDWLREVHQYADDDISIYLVGNKCDLTGKRLISDELGKVHNLRLNTAMTYRRWPSELDRILSKLRPKVQKM